jgi:DeoR/GlpR family transcriptional regulator of sugar metabolism
VPTTETGGTQMLAKQRQAVILEEVRRSGWVRVGDLTELLQVSDMTIRRDLDVLAESGLVEKVHGGATTVGERSTFEPGFEAKSFRERLEKEAIAELAATLVRPGSAIGLNAGTTTWALARRLGEVPNLTVVTNSMQVAGVFHQHDRGDQTVVLTGGLRTPSDALVGPVAIGSIRSLNLDVVFMGVHGMDPRRGFTTPNLMEAEANRALAEAARRVVVVADHTKWGVIGLCSILDLDQAEVLVTDAGLGEEAREVLAEQVGELLLAPVRGQAAEAG